MAKNKKSTQPQEPMITRVLKVVLYIILGFVWVKFTPPVMGLTGVPLGLFLGAIFASQDHFAIDRKIEFAVLIVSTIAAYWLPVGLFV